MINNYIERKNEMDEVLDTLFQMGKNRTLSEKTVYGILCFKNLKREDCKIDENHQKVLDGLDNSNFFDDWIEHFKDKQNINVFYDPKWEHFCQFKNGYLDENGEFIKLYIPIDAAHLYNGANMLFEFLEANNIMHLSKISRKLRVDNVIIRLDANDTENARKIIDFINNNPYLKASLNKPNPFVPSVDGIGYMLEHGNSYNSDISVYIKEYINRANSLRYTSVSAENFRQFLNECKRRNVTFNSEQINFDNSLLSTFEIAYYGQNKDLNANNKINLTHEKKIALLINSLKATYYKYGIKQVKHALLQITRQNDYSYITNGDASFRDLLKEYVTPSDVLNIINSVNQVRNGLPLNSLEDKIEVYCSDLFYDELPFRLDEICNVTIENYDEMHLSSAINNYLKSGNTIGFSRFKGQDKSINYRDELKMFDHQSFKYAIIRSLSNRGINTRELEGENLINLYASTLARENLSNITL